MRKRETLIESKRYVSKFDFYIEKETFIQTVDSHLEALDKIDQLTAERDILREYIRTLKGATDEDPTDPARPNDTC